MLCKIHEQKPGTEEMRLETPDEKSEGDKWRDGKA